MNNKHNLEDRIKELERQNRSLRAKVDVLMVLKTITCGLALPFILPNPYSQYDLLIFYVLILSTDLLVLSLIDKIID
jgi:hypothetical protein